jgi:hypothetical protein
MALLMELLFLQGSIEIHFDPKFFPQDLHEFPRSSLHKRGRSLLMTAISRLEGAEMRGWLSGKG